MRRTALLDVRDRYAVRCAGRARPGGQRRGQASRTRSMTPRKIADMVEGNLVHQEHRVEGIATQDALAAAPIPGLRSSGATRTSHERLPVRQWSRWPRTTASSDRTARRERAAPECAAHRRNGLRRGTATPGVADGG